ncbi:MAG: protein phosphatase 2C domain-containing protein [bacterium]|nr:protein phosphatase 2C domain-containing protein [bacterium]
MKAGSSQLPITWAPGESGPNSTGEYRIAIAEEPLKAQDCMLSMERQGVFAVFDGMGGVGGANSGQVASNLAAKVCRDAYSDFEGLGRNLTEEIDRMRDWLNLADSTIATQPESMGTTGTAIRLVEDSGKLFAVWGNVGDSRFYVYRDGKITLISEDEGEGHILTNCLGNNKGVKQLGAVELQPGDRLMLCSDGITGDYDDDVLSESELASALSLPNTQAAAETLLRISRKYDDKTVAVIDIDEFGSEIQSSSIRKLRLGESEQFVFNTDKPLEDRGSYNVVAQIDAADKELLLLDLRSAPTVDGQRIPFGQSSGYWDADFLLVDESFFGKWGLPSRDQAGYKGVRPGDKIVFGRYHDHNGRFEFSDFVSGTHFGLVYNGDCVLIENLRPKNNTEVTVKQ